MTNLSPGQRAGIEKIQRWYESEPLEPFRLFGPAGTGKTTMAREIPRALGLDQVVYGTYTGKAAHVLRSKGCEPASTIHSAIYCITANTKAREQLGAAREELGQMQALMALIHKERESDPIMAGAMLVDAGWSDMLELGGAIDETQEEIAELKKVIRRPNWEFDPFNDWTGADLIVLDEVSMVDVKLATDVERCGVPILVLGDPAQLPPIEGGGYYTEAIPDHLLTEVHRQALESPVLALATAIRETRGTDLSPLADARVPVSLRHAMEHDQILCWSNPRRWKIIDAIRHALGRPPGHPVTGDRIMCLTNSRDLGVFNGQQFDVVSGPPAGTDWYDAPDSPGPVLTLRDDEGHERVIPCLADGFLGRAQQDAAKSSGAGGKGRWMLATFAQAITVHKAQGSEWASVYVVDDTPGMIAMEARRTSATVAHRQARRWAYTAVSRASETVTVAGKR